MAYRSNFGDPIGDNLEAFRNKGSEDDSFSDSKRDFFKKKTRRTNRVRFNREEEEDSENDYSYSVSREKENSSKKNINIIELIKYEVSAQIDRHKYKYKEGRDGLDGKNGVDGRDGRDGANGVNGLDGPPGQNGQNGLNGLDGKNGLDGAPGLPGRDGLDGKNGLDGVNGRDGLDGCPGADGKTGSQGVPGADGRDGLNGRDGRDGKNGRDAKDGGTSSIYLRSINNQSKTSSINLFQEVKFEQKASGPMVGWSRVSDSRWVCNENGWFSCKFRINISGSNQTINDLNGTSIRYACALMLNDHQVPGSEAVGQNIILTTLNELDHSFTFYYKAGQILSLQWWAGYYDNTNTNLLNTITDITLGAVNSLFSGSLIGASFNPSSGNNGFQNNTASLNLVRIALDHKSEDCESKDNKDKDKDRRNREKEDSEEDSSSSSSEEKQKHRRRKVKKEKEREEKERRRREKESTDESD